MISARVAGDPLDLFDGDVDGVAGLEAELQVLAVLPGPAPAEHLLVARHAVVHVDHGVAGGEPLHHVARDEASKRLGAPDADVPEELAVGDEDQAVGTSGKAAVEAALDQADGAGRRGGLEARDHGDGATGLRQQVRKARRLV